MELPAQAGGAKKAKGLLEQEKPLFRDRNYWGPNFPGLCRVWRGRGGFDLELIF
jgi:hypothetical protein